MEKIYQHEKHMVFDYLLYPIEYFAILSLEFRNSLAAEKKWLVFEKFRSF